MKAPLRFIKACVVEYYLDHPSGGNLHILLDDGNCRPSDLQFCLGEAVRHRDVEGQYLCEMLLPFSESELETMLATDFETTKAEDA